MESKPNLDFSLVEHPHFSEYPFRGFRRGTPFSYHNLTERSDGFAQTQRHGMPVGDLELREDGVLGFTIGVAYRPYSLQHLTDWDCFQSPIPHEFSKRGKHLESMAYRHLPGHDCRADHHQGISG